MFIRAVLPIVISAMLATAATARAQEPQSPEAAPPPAVTIPFPVITHHTGQFNGKRVRYTATVDALDVADAAGHPGARLVSTAYTADHVKDPAARPVMFVFNGGPISPSVYLHVGSFGPKRVAFADDLTVDARTAPLVDNPYCILDATDLVYFDPAGTGFSRAAQGKPLTDYFSVAADGQETAAFIAGWLAKHGRLHSPAYVFGESYGTMRAAETARQLAEMKQPVLLDGVVLMGQALNIIEWAQRPDNIISYVVSLPTLAALGWYHGKVERKGTDFESFLAAAQHFAETEYLDVLYRGNTVPLDEMRRTAERLQAYTGLRASYFMEKRLRVSKEEYRVELLKDQGQVLGRSDGRYIAPIGKDGGKPDPASVLVDVLQKAFFTYLKDSLGVADTSGYVVKSPVKGLDGWDWGGKSPFSRFAYARSISEWLQKNPRARVLVGTGYFDTMTTVGASEYLVKQEDWPRGGVMLERYYGGHMPYSVAATAAKVARDLRTLIETTK